MVQQTNPGSMVDLKTTDDGKFLYVYMALHASINGWKHCIPIIIVDGTFLKSKFGGTLLSATTQDASGKIFPLAFAIVDSENDASWEWFFVQVKKTFGVKDKLSIISNRHESIISIVKEVYPEASHAFCIFHIINNLKIKFKRNTLQIKELCLAATKSYKIEDFDSNMSEIRNINERVHQYLQDIGLDKRTKVHSMNNRFRMMTSNIAESLNSTIKNARELPITTLLEYLRGLMQEWTSTNKNIALSTFTKLGKKPEEILNQNYMKSLKLKVSSKNFSSIIDIIIITKCCFFAFWVFLVLNFSQLILWHTKKSMNKYFKS